MEFLSRTWTDDKCTYGDNSTPIDYTVCLNANQNPYKLQLKAYIDTTAALFVPFNTMSLQSSNTAEQFYVRPIDPCHTATLTAYPIPVLTAFPTLNAIYFVSDVETYVSTSTT